MEYGRAIIVDKLRSVELGRSQPVIYDREIGLRLLYQDPDSGAEHYLVRYPAGLRARLHGTQPPTPSWFSKAGLRSTTRSSVQRPTVTSRPDRR
jgi:hypothetical protein